MSRAKRDLILYVNGDRVSLSRWSRARASPTLCGKTATSPGRTSAASMACAGPAPSFLMVNPCGPA